MSNFNLDLLENPSSFKGPSNYNDVMNNVLISDLLYTHEIETTDATNAFETIRNFNSPNMKSTFIRQLCTSKSTSLLFHFPKELVPRISETEFEMRFEKFYWQLDIVYWKALICIFKIDKVIPSQSATYEQNNEIKSLLKKYTKFGDEYIPFNRENIKDLFHNVEKILDIKHLKFIEEIKESLKFKYCENGCLEIHGNAQLNVYLHKNQLNDNHTALMRHWAYILLSQTYDDWVYRLCGFWENNRNTLKSCGVYFHRDERNYHVLTLSKEVQNTFKHLVDIEIPIEN